MKIKNKMPMYIAVQLENGNKNVWLPLPATKERFSEALQRIGGQNGSFIIKQYNCRVPAIGRYMLMEEPLAVVNYLASRLNKLYDFEVLTLCAICDSDNYFYSAQQFIDYTFQTHCYTLLPGITDEEMLATRYLNIKNSKSDIQLKEFVDKRKLGKQLAADENGVFVAHGYLTSLIGWKLPPSERRVPDSLNLKGVLNEDLYGDYENADV